MAKKKGKEGGDYKEVRPPIETNMGFDEVLKRMSKTDPNEVRKLEKDKKTE